MIPTSYRLPASPWQRSAVLAIVGGLVVAAGLFVEPKRTWINVFLASNYLIGLGLAGLLLVALLYVTGATWSLPIRRVLEAMTAILPVGAIMMVAVLVFWPTLYSWSTADVAESGASPLHRLWLNRPFFLARSLVYFTLWLIFAAAIVRNSRRQDTESAPGPTARNIRLSAAFLVVFGITCWLASGDWIMSLEPKWSSTIFGVYNFSSLFLSGIAAAILLVLWLRRHSPLKDVITADHLHDLGTLLFAFSSFWMYIWFCQYLLIWYVNNPEETVYLRLRWHGAWPILLFLDLGLNWAIPFIVLIFRSSKRNPVILGLVACVVLVGRWVDLSLMVLPTQSEAVPMPGLWEIGLVVGMAGIFVCAAFFSLSRAPLVPIQETSASR
jgi:hypothetical protein